MLQFRNKSVSLKNCSTEHFTIFQLLTQRQRDVNVYKGNVDSPSNINIQKP